MKYFQNRKSKLFNTSVIRSVFENLNSRLLILPAVFWRKEKISTLKKNYANSSSILFSYLVQFLSPGSKYRKKVPPKKSSSIFEKWNTLVLILRNVLYFRKRNFLIFQETETLKIFLYFPKWNLALFTPSSKKLKNPPRKKFLIFQEIKLSNCKIKKFLVFSKESFSFISGNGTLMYFSAQAWKQISPEKKSLYFRKWNFLAPRRINKTFLKFLLPKKT